jgi:hypothetical protein
VHEWLLGPGGVPKANTKLIRSCDFPKSTDIFQASPQKQAITGAFDWLESMAQRNDANMKGLRVGRRLYVYMSGHGFAPERKKAGLFMANATRTRTHHVFASAWMDWFYNARYFDEFVLWMDCCLTFSLSLVPEPAGYRILQGTTPVGRMFSAYASVYPGQAVENKMADGTWHGVFTYALLEGLKGAGADPITKDITSASLKNYLINHMKTFMTDAQLNDSRVSKEPDFGADDPFLFGSVPKLPTFNVMLQFPASVPDGVEFHVRTGSPPSEVTTGKVRNGTAQLSLQVGLYFVDTRVPQLLTGFEVPGGGDVIVNVGT